MTRAEYYPVRTNLFNSTNDPHTIGLKTLNSGGRDLFWEVQFRMPAFVHKVRITGNRPRDLHGARLTLLSATRQVLYKSTLERDRNILDVRGTYRGQVYFLRIGQLSSSIVSIANVKVNAIQGIWSHMDIITFLTDPRFDVIVPPGINCSNHIERILNGCYGFSKPRIGTNAVAQNHQVRYECIIGFRLSSDFKNSMHWCDSKPFISPQCEKGKNMQVMSSHCLERGSNDWWYRESGMFFATGSSQLELHCH